MSDLVENTQKVPRPQSVESLFDATIIGGGIEPSERFSHSTRTAVEKLAAEQSEVQSTVRRARLNDAINKQDKVISATSAFSTAEFRAEFKSLERALDLKKNPQERNALQKDLENARFLMAAPFIERARRAAIEMKNGQEFTAEKTLQDALNQRIPQEAMSVPEISRLRDDVKEQRDELHVKNDLLDQWDSYIGKLSKITGRQDLRKSDLTPSALADPEFGALNRFLLKNYDELTKKNQFWSPEGISRSYIQDYARHRNNRLNDFRR